MTLTPEQHEAAQKLAEQIVDGMRITVGPAFIQEPMPEWRKLWHEARDQRRAGKLEQAIALLNKAKPMMMALTPWPGIGSWVELPRCLIAAGRTHEAVDEFNWLLKTAEKRHEEPPMPLGPIGKRHRMAWDAFELCKQMRIGFKKAKKLDRKS